MESHRQEERRSEPAAVGMTQGARASRWPPHSFGHDAAAREPNVIATERKSHSHILVVARPGGAAPPGENLVKETW